MAWSEYDTPKTAILVTLITFCRLFIQLKLESLGLYGLNWVYETHNSFGNLFWLKTFNQGGESLRKPLIKPFMEPLRVGPDGYSFGCT